METFSALLAICAGNSPVTGEFPAQRPVTRSFDVFFDLRLNEGWVNNREAGDLSRHGAHYYVTVISIALHRIFLMTGREYNSHVISGDQLQRPGACLLASFKFSPSIDK